MTRRFVIGVLSAGAISVVIYGSELDRAAAADHAECSHLVMLRFPDVRIAEAVTVPAATTGAVRASHCKVTGVIGSEIRFALLLPDQWNHKFLMGGGGGYVGSIDNQAQAVVNSGYATVGTDTGHQGGVTDASWALDNPERQLNFGSLAVHRTAETAKAIARSYYGSTETRSYFSGCSNGGRQALMEAQRYPDDFDGIVAGAPAYDFVGIAAQFVKDIQAAFPDPHNQSPMFTLETLKSVETQILEKCDTLDGVKDGVMEDPRRCSVDPSALSGLTDAQRAALKKIYAETGAKGRAIYAAQPVGGEGQRAGWPSWIVGMQPGPVPQGPSLRFAFGTQFFKYFVFNDPDWDYSRYDVGNARTGRADRRQPAQRDQPRPRWVQVQGAQADHVARLGRRRTHAARDRSVITSRSTLAIRGRRLFPDVDDARRPALCRGPGPRHGGLDDRDRRVGREREGAGSRHRPKVECKGSRFEYAAALSPIRKKRNTREGQHG